LKGLLALETLQEEFDGMAYVAAASSIRPALMKRYRSDGWDEVENESYVKNDENRLLSYRGHLKFLELDLAYLYPADEERLRSKLKRALKKSQRPCCVAEKPSHVRYARIFLTTSVSLSTHLPVITRYQSNIIPIPNTVTLWHSTIAFRLNGKMIVRRCRMFEQMDNMELIHQDGKPPYFRERPKPYY